MVFLSILVGGLVAIFFFPRNIGLLSSSQLTKSYFSEGWPWPTNQVRLQKQRDPTEVGPGEGRIYRRPCFLWKRISIWKGKMLSKYITWYILSKCNVCIIWYNITSSTNHRGLFPGFFRVVHVFTVFAPLMEKLPLSSWLNPIIQAGALPTW